MVVNSLMEKYPNTDKVAFRLLIGGAVVGVNPKINNMNKAYEVAKYDFVLISDSGIRSELQFVNLLFIKCSSYSERRYTSGYDEFYD